MNQSKGRITPRNRRETRMQKWIVGVTCMPQFCGYSRVLLFLACLGLLPTVAFSQQPAPTEQPAADTKKPDAPPSASAQDSGPQGGISIQQGTTLHLNVNLVQVHVTVRDSNGKAIGNLRKDDFLLYDQGKLQPISTFAVETRESRIEKAEAAAKTQVADNQPIPAAVPSALPDRFVALVFDDSHISIQDATYLRTQAFKFIDGVAPMDRVGIFSSSGQMAHDFTKDKDALKQTLMGLVPRPLFPVDPSACPDMTHYEADQIVNYHNPLVLEVLTQWVLDRCPLPGCGTADECRKMAESKVRTEASFVLDLGDTAAQFVYRFMEDVLRRLMGRPGERIMVLASPGFLTTISQYLDISGVIDRANQFNIVINTLDARGLYVLAPGGDIEVYNYDPVVAGQIANFQIAAQSEQASVLRDFAQGTGGVYYGNSNDLAAGLNQLGAAPEVSYILGFYPQKQKMDGTFHALKVSLAQKNKYTIQARRGYFIPRPLDDPAAQEHQEIVAAVFSRDEIVDLHLQIQTQYFKSSATEARLSVVSRIDLKGVRVRKSESWTLGNLTVVTAIFDDNGNYVSGHQKAVELKLQDPAYEKLLRTGLGVKTDFDLKPGRYLVRQVVSDSEGGQMAARNASVDIPY
jgi:VWFA-related protein